MFEQKPQVTVFDGDTNKTTEEMRAELFRLARGRNDYLPEFRHTQHLVRLVEDLANHRGLTGEDKYTVLAYVTLKALDKAQELLLQQFSLSPMNPVLMNEQQRQAPQGVAP